MAQFFKAKPNKAKQMSAKQQFNITQLDHLGAGVSEAQGKIVFVPGALPGETVTAQLIEQKKRFAKAKLLRIDVASNHRVASGCAFYGQCGGCDLQHLALPMQRENKQQALVNLLDKMGQAQALQLAEPLVGEAWGYRRKARLATQYQRDSKTLSLGFRALASNQVVAIDQCPVLAPALSQLIAPLTLCLNTLEAKRSLGHVELVAVESANMVVLRITQALSDADIARLRAFGVEHCVRLVLLDEHGHIDNLDGDTSLPYYRLDDGSQLGFAPGNFIQVNADVNRNMVKQAIEWLDIKPTERVLDLFCGVGNFTIALAKAGAQVVGVEGVPAMVATAKDNAVANGVSGVEFYHADLSADLSEQPWLGQIDKLLLDPARAGAFESLQWLKQMKPKAVLYVSCNPVSLARDSQQLLKQGYRLQKLGLIDMFPQTHHIEAMALFERD
ncbi:23S rRNA (uracil(1939)-C(5))-methyltransferase RlmD [Shewanella algidipiscicola]|uniref:23S rRNA (uracil(1939)-C(5))-methyltransferase RlmD n=1 Tax=Shewanella algidipiscicola TaxID=614070 RepID=A0ABQ4P8X9_9GAMM|nr:23S rRNA (uracil(1939)-C(5))-methyltransferase RlmD [Shewanella algidipiscicola]GIU43985.1 23S rRNA (uracil(1939)-C(5))-methyltransferase RlmD [Shewanella algidipiscicola]